MTNSSARAPQPWEVWLAYVRFADHPDVGKVRPVVILDNEIAAAVVAKVTQPSLSRSSPIASSRIGKKRAF